MAYTLYTNRQSTTPTAMNPFVDFYFSQRTQFLGLDYPSSLLTRMMN